MTPAPWLRRRPASNRVYRFHRRPEDNDYPLEVWGADGAEVCRIGGSPDCPEDDATNQANARLIAAAPDLLAAVRESLIVLAQFHITEPARHARLAEMIKTHTALLDLVEGR